MTKMKLAVFAMATAGIAFTGLAATTKTANAVVYCTYIGYPSGCIARPGVRLVARPGGVGAVTAPRPGNRNGGVNRVGVRR
ncbi:hypothetical protein [Bosea sp. NBC_00550]|uniref:hypothetical protein n=1 Tax=Bosea sp. NBC_00550 TaxID=2969621 RepID=UPI003FA45A22